MRESSRTRSSRLSIVPATKMLWLILIGLAHADALASVASASSSSTASAGLPEALGTPCRDGATVIPKQVRRQGPQQIVDLDIKLGHWEANTKVTIVFFGAVENNGGELSGLAEKPTNLGSCSIVEWQDMGVVLQLADQPPDRVIRMRVQTTGVLDHSKIGVLCAPRSPSPPLPPKTPPPAPPPSPPPSAAFEIGFFTTVGLLGLLIALIGLAKIYGRLGNAGHSGQHGSAKSSLRGAGKRFARIEG